MTRRVLFEKAYLKFRILQENDDIVVCRGFCRKSIENLLEDDKLIFVYASFKEFEMESLFKNPITSDWITIFECEKAMSDIDLLIFHDNRMDRLKKQNEYWVPVGLTTNGKIMFDV